MTTGRLGGMPGARLTKVGQTPTFTDGQIAAIASVNGLILITRNVADYVSFEDLTLRTSLFTSVSREQ
jgi:tRNA(fMet)-specific endonuclease VapC